MALVFEDPFYFPNFSLDFSANFLGRSLIGQVGIADRAACLFFDFALGLVNAAPRSIACARFHNKESHLVERERLRARSVRL